VLITKEVYAGLAYKTIKHFEGKGYKIPRRISQGKNSVKQGTKIKVKVEDLPEGSGALVDIECDGCGKLLEDIRWGDYLRQVKEDGKYYCHKCANAGFKKYISFTEWCYINLLKEKADIIVDRWCDDLNIDKDGNKIKITEATYGSDKGYWFKCIDHSEHEPELKNINSFTQGRGSIECNQCNSVLITHPEIIKYLVNIEDANKSMGSHEQTLVKCPDCGYEKEMLIPTLITRGWISCPKCSDGIPYPEKFMFNVLEQLLNKDFITQLSKTTFKWCSKYLYDFYLNKINCIIETHGGQHYIESFNRIYKDAKSLVEIQDNDKNKQLLAKDNNIEHYIIIDCRISEMEFIKSNIMSSKLPRLLNFKEQDIDWLKCHEFSCSSLIKKACNMWSNNSLQEIADKLKVHKETVRGYLKQGFKLGWCDYNLIKIHHQQIICLNTSEIFEKIVDASNQYKNINKSSISMCCTGNAKSAGRSIETNEKMVWMYYKDYIVKTSVEINNMLIDANVIQRKPFSRKVICLTTGEIFISLKEAGSKYNIAPSSISACCSINKVNKSGGKHPETGEKMVWEYV